MKLSNPKNLLLITIFLAPLYLARVSFIDLHSNVFEIFAVFSSLLNIFFERKKFLSKIKEIPWSLSIPGDLILLGLILSIIFNNNVQVGFGILKGWFLIPIIFSVALYLSVDSDFYIKKVYTAILFSSSIVGLVALCYKVLNIVTYDNRLSAFYLSPNYLAMYIAPAIILGIYLLSVSKNLKQKIAYLLLLIPVLLSLYLTYSYSTWISLLLTFVLLSFIQKKITMRYFFLLLATLFLLFVTQFKSEKFNNLFENFSRSSLSSRITIWNVSIKLIKENPILGIGAGNFQTAYLAKQSEFPPYLEWAVPQPHNIFLAFWLQTGILGLIGFLTLLLKLFKELFMLLNNKKSAVLATPLLGFFIYTLLHGLIDTTYWKNDLAFIFWIFVILVISLSDLKNPNYND